MWASVWGDVTRGLGSPRKMQCFKVTEVRVSVEGGEITARREVGAGVGQTVGGEGGDRKGPYDDVPKGLREESWRENETQKRVFQKPRPGTANKQGSQRSTVWIGLQALNRHLMRSRASLALPGEGLRMEAPVEGLGMEQASRR